MLATLPLALMIAGPLVAVAAASDRTAASLPAAMDQVLAHEMIQLAQLHLKLAGFNPGRIDGVLDAPRSAAVRQYQVVHVIPMSGLLDETTRRVLLPGSQDAREG